MDDFTPSSLHESQNEWSARLLTILTPHIIEGFRSVLEESVKLCNANDEMEKYLMTFQNFISRIPKWNLDLIQKETDRIIAKSGCDYLEDLITCVHVIQLKILTAVRVGQKAKKVDIDIMRVNDFVHKVYVNSARQMYKNVYLFDIHVPPLQQQKHNRELEIIVQECILNTIRDSIPVQTILKCYLDETSEEDIHEEVREEDVTPEDEKEKEEENIVLETAETDKESAKREVEEDQTGGSIASPKLDIVKNAAEAFSGISSSSEGETNVPKLSFNDVDNAVDENKNEYEISAPKSIERLEEISRIRNDVRKQEEQDDEEEDRITISTESINLNDLDIHNISENSKIDLKPNLLMNEVEILP